MKYSQIADRFRYLMLEAVSDDYYGRIAEVILPDVLADVDECADEEDWNDDDVRLAIGRALCNHIGIEF